MKLFAAVVLISALCACASSERSMPGFQIDEALKGEMAKIAGYRIFFGHQSVGDNIVQGLQELRSSAGATQLNVVNLRPGAPLPDAFFAEAKVGENQRPRTKLEEFSRLLDSGLAERTDIALVKLCYVDFGAESDTAVDALLDAYVGTVKSLEAAHPGLVVIPVTAPLVASSEGSGFIRGLKTALKRMLGREVDNDLRNTFNARLREAFRGRPIFDLAAAESMAPDGSRETYGVNGLQALVSEYTSDGGHLNELGRKVAARELVRVLAGVPVSRQAAVASAAK